MGVFLFEELSKKSLKKAIIYTALGWKMNTDICSANYLTGFYMMTTLAFNELKEFCFEGFTSLTSELKNVNPIQ